MLQTQRLLLCKPDPALAGAVANFLHRNAAHLSPWEPPRPPQLATAAHQRELLASQALAHAAGNAYRWFLIQPEAPDRVIGSVSLSNVVRGPQHGASVGYALDAQAQGQGFMHEALQAVIAHAFGLLNLHRLQAAYRPENARSATVLARLGFREIGLAQGYLFIDGDWRDHLLTELINPGFVLPHDWTR